MSGNRYMTFGRNFEGTPGTEKEIKADILFFFREQWLFMTLFVEDFSIWC